MRKVFVSYSRNNLDWVVMRTHAQRQHKFDLEKETQLHEGGVPLLRGLMDQGQLDAVQMFNSLTPDMVASGKYRILATIRGLIKELDMPDTPFLLYSADSTFAAAHPARMKAYLAAYREAIEILRKDDAVWVEREQKLLRIILWPSLIAAWVLGLALAASIGAFGQGWFHAKLALVLGLTAYHVWLAGYAAALARGERKLTGKQLRMLNEIPGVAAALIVVLVIVKPF